MRLEICLLYTSLLSELKNYCDSTGIPFEFCSMDTKDKQMLEPVSYTHLDVYKRQELRRQAHPSST